MKGLILKYIYTAGQVTSSPQFHFKSCPLVQQINVFRGERNDLTKVLRAARRGNPERKSGAGRA